MQILNETSYLAGWTLGFRPDGREQATVAVKGTFRLRADVDRATQRLADEQIPLCEADVFGPDPAKNAPRLENDFAPFKPRCDVLVSGSAYAPGGAPVKRFDAGLQVGPCRKLFQVIGPRRWRRAITGSAASEPEAIDAVALSYDHAFGGTDQDPDNPDVVHTFLANPVGKGFCRVRENLDGLPLPLTEALGQAVTDPSGSYTPMALGPIGRNWLPRFQYAGTYDERWQAERLPLFPDDFDSRYFQSSASDQQIPYPAGGESIALVNLSKDGRIYTEIPRDSLVVLFVLRKGEAVKVDAACDTILIEPDEDKLCLTWRASYALARDPFELREMVVMPAARYSPMRARARATRKPYFDNIAAAARQQPRGHQ